ncbi:MAG TPA: hypothetical protein VK773_11790 [Acidimicrobiales bacterium]|jgi:hypothetical protein|nr:hypothetical protein [Acidimicrobiales bacterium]
MKKLTFMIGAATGFIVGSCMGRGPYDKLEGAARQVVNHPKVQTMLHSAADSAESVRDATLDATTDAIDDVSQAATRAIDETSKRFRNGAKEVASNVGNGA